MLVDGQETGRKPQGQRQPPTGPGQCVRLRADAWRNLEHQRARFRRLHHAQIHGVQAGHGEVLPGGDEDQATRGRGQERRDLAGIFGVVEQQQGALAFEGLAENRGQLLLGLRQLRGRIKEAQNGAEHVGGTERLGTHALEIEFDLCIRVIGPQPRSELPGQLRFPGSRPCRERR